MIERFRESKDGLASRYIDILMQAMRLGTKWPHLVPPSLASAVAVVARSDWDGSVYIGVCKCDPTGLPIIETASISICPDCGAQVVLIKMMFKVKGGQIRWPQVRQGRGSTPRTGSIESLDHDARGASEK